MTGADRGDDTPQAVAVDLIDPSGFSLPYDHGLAAALASHGARPRLITSRFGYGAPPAPAGYRRVEHFYRRAPGAAGSRARTLAKGLSHPVDVLAYRRSVTRASSARRPDVLHYQWLAFPILDLTLRPPLPTVVTLHDPPPGAAAGASRLRAGALRRSLGRVDAVVVHTAAAAAFVHDRIGLDPARIHVIPHGALTHLRDHADAQLPPELSEPGRPVVLCFGLIRPYKGIETLIDAWPADVDAELWIVGRPVIDITPLRARAPSGVRFLTRFTTDAEQAALLRRADLVVAPYLRGDRFGFSGVLASAIALGRPILTTDVAGFDELVAAGAARAVPAGDAAALRGAIGALLADHAAREALAAAAAEAAATTYSWDRIATATLALYERVLSR